MIATQRLGETLVVTSTTLPWVTGRLCGHEFSAKVYAEHCHPNHSTMEMGYSRISKLYVTRMTDGQGVCHFDRDWDLRPVDPMARMIVGVIMAVLADRVYGGQER